MIIRFLELKEQKFYEHLQNHMLGMYLVMVRKTNEVSDTVRTQPPLYLYPSLILKRNDTKLILIYFNKKYFEKTPLERSFFVLFFNYDLCLHHTVKSTMIKICPLILKCKSVTISSIECGRFERFSSIWDDIVRSTIMVGPRNLCAFFYGYSFWIKRKSFDINWNFCFLSIANRRSCLWTQRTLWLRRWGFAFQFFSGIFKHQFVCHSCYKK